MLGNRGEVNLIVKEKEMHVLKGNREAILKLKKEKQVLKDRKECDPNFKKKGKQVL